jgi:epoxyqueuosine reductase
MKTSVSECKTSCGNCSGCRPSDSKAGFEVNERFSRISQKLDMFNRAAWDDSVRSPRVEQFFGSYFTDLAEFRAVEGFGHRDYALRNASWYIADFTADLFETTDDRKEGFLDSFTILRPGAKRKLEGTSAEENSVDLKRASRFLGADLVGICAWDERWVYTHNYSRAKLKEKPIDLPDDLPWVVVIANSMDIETIKTVPSALSGAATGQGYSRDIIAVLSIAAYIRNLGYQAVASLNDTALSIPLAIQAGLGEYGRHGMLITPEFGPRVRIAKIFTDFPLQADEPISFGVKNFCEICRRCSQSCPPKAIPDGPPSDQKLTISNLDGIKKWTVDPEKCFKFWTNQGTDCSICIRVCPYNKDYSKAIHRWGRRLAGTRLRRLMLWLDHRLGYGKRSKPSKWWKVGAANEP